MQGKPRQATYVQLAPLTHSPFCFHVFILSETLFIPPFPAFSSSLMYPRVHLVQFQTCFSWIPSNFIFPKAVTAFWGWWAQAGSPSSHSLWWGLHPSSEELGHGLCFSQWVVGIPQPGSMLLCSFVCFEVSFLSRSWTVAIPVYCLICWKENFGYFDSY